MLNSYEIDELADLLGTYAPEIAPYAVYLRDWRDTVNANSDGWAYWRGGTRPAQKLCELLSGARGALRGHGEMPTEADLKKALSPIKAAATKNNLPAPVLTEPVAAPGLR